MSVKQVQVVERSDASPFYYSAMNGESSWKKSQKKKKKETTLCWQPKVKKNLFWHALCIHFFSHTLAKMLRGTVLMKELMFFPTKQLWRFSKLPFSELVVPQEFTSELAPLKLDFQTYFSNLCMRIYILLTSLCSLVASSVLIFCLINFMEIMVSTHKTKYGCCQFIYILSSLPVKLSCSKWWDISNKAYRKNFHIALKHSHAEQKNNS